MNDFFLFLNNQYWYDQGWIPQMDFQGVYPEGAVGEEEWIGMARFEIEGSGGEGPVETS